MYCYGADEAAGVLVSLFTLANTTDADYERAIDQIVAADAQAARAGTFVHVVVVDSHSETAPAKWRKRFGETEKALLSPRMFFALVTQSAVTRAAMTAVRWIAGSRPEHHHNTFATYAAASRWVRQASWEPYPQLEQLLAQARAAASGDSRARSVS